MLLIDVHKVSSVSARKLRCPSSARLRSGNFSSNSSLQAMYIFVFRKYLPRKIRNQILPDSYAKNPFKLFEEKCIILKIYYFNENYSIFLTPNFKWWLLTLRIQNKNYILIAILFFGHLHSRNPPTAGWLAA